MAEDDDSLSNRKSPKNAEVGAGDDKNEHDSPKPDLGIEESKYNTNESGEGDAAEAKSSTSKTGGTVRKEENPFSFRHFLKRDLSLPGNATFENTGARPKVYAKTVQHSPTKPETNEHKREKSRSSDSHAKEEHRIRDPVEIPFSVVDSKNDLYNQDSYYHRPNIASEPLGMPSLPDFVQDHILVEQAYSVQPGPLSVDMDRLPDFTFNTSYSSRRFDEGTRDYDYDDGPSGSLRGAEWCPSRDLRGVAADPPHLSLDLTECVNPVDRRNTSPRHSFPIDRSGPSGVESMRLPDFLPTHPGRISPDNDNENYQLQAAVAQLELTRSELTSERLRRSDLEKELKAAQVEAALLRSRHEQDPTAAWLYRHFPAKNGTGACAVDSEDMQSRSADSEASVIARLKNQVKILKEELAASQNQTRELRSSQRAVGRSIRMAASHAEASIKQLLEGVEQLKALASTLDPP